MQTTAVNMAQVQYQATGTTPTPTPNGEDFLALMMGFMQGGEQSTDEMQSLIDGMLPQNGKSKDTTANDYAMQMMAGLFAGLPNGIPSGLIDQNPLSYSEGLSGNDAMTQMQQAILQMTGQTANPQQATATGFEQAAAKVLEGAIQLEQNAASAEQANERVLIPDIQLAKGSITEAKPTVNGQPGTEDSADAKLDTELLAAQIRTGTADGAQLGYGQQQSDLDRLNATIKRMAGDTEKPLDIEALQAAVDSGKYLQANRTGDVSTANIPATADLVAQVKTGIVSNLKSGGSDRSEFTIKLKPEGMGEITVKMTEVGGKISLSLTTTSQQTQNLLSGQISGLREALRPYNAEIQQIVSQPQTELQQGMGEHQHNGSQQQNRQQNSTYSQWEQPDTEQKQEYSSVLSAGLNAYV